MRGRRQIMLACGAVALVAALTYGSTPATVPPASPVALLEIPTPGSVECCALADDGQCALDVSPRCIFGPFQVGHRRIR